MNANYTYRDHFSGSSQLAAWIRSPGVRETFESVLIAILLALLFRFFEAEAFVIPTGSMAPDLQGQHIDVECPECGFHYLAGASAGGENQTRPIKTVGCPMCRFDLELRPYQDRQHRPFSGDRILVNKFAYDFAEPERFDVIVFKYPNNGKQNFIKRLIGLPGEGLLIEYGDIYTYDLESESFEDRQIARKSPRKLNSMLMVVDDTRFIPAALEDSGWPSLWDQWSRGAHPGWTRVRDSRDDAPKFSLQPEATTQWLRYRHLKPGRADWQAIQAGENPPRISNGIPPGELITDYYAYNDTTETVRRIEGNREVQFDRQSPNGMHWVGDLGMRAWVDVQSESGLLKLQTVEGGVAYTCSIDVSTGQATFSASSDNVRFDGQPVAPTPVRGNGSWDIQFANADDQLFLWVNGKSIDIPGATFSRSGPVTPVYDQDGPSDSEPLGIGGQDISLTVTRLQVLRDIYYTSKNNTREAAVDPQPSTEYSGIQDMNLIKAILQNPSRWDSPQGARLFASRDRDETWVFPLGPHQLLPMGDNSPQSNDARIWNGERYVDDSYLLGEALFIYWPHAKTKPIPFFPNFERMTFIR